MILVWKDLASFCQHLHDMRVFWRLHRMNPQYKWNKVKDMPAVRDIQLQSQAGGANRLFSPSGNLIVVPIWKIKPPRGIQN